MKRNTKRPSRQGRIWFFLTSRGRGAKLKATIDTKEQFLKCIEKIISLDVPEEEDVFHQSVGFLVRSIVATFNRAEKQDTVFFDQLFVCLKLLKVKPQSPAYSSLMLAFLRAKEWWMNFGTFCRWWGWNSFMEEDYKPTQTEDGQKIMPLAERVFMAYCRFLCDYGQKEEIKQYLPIVEKVYSEHADYIYLPFYEAKLMLKIGEIEKFWTLMKLFARKKSSEFWVWDLFGDATEDNQTKLTFYAKSLICKTKPEMSIKVREKTALLLLHLGYKAEALRELNEAVKIRTKNKWNVPRQFSDAITSLGSENINPTVDNVAFFTNLAKKAECSVFGRTEVLEYEGKIMIKEKGFGFVHYKSNSIYVPQKLISLKGICNNDIVYGQYKASYDKKKNKEGFAAISINKR